jgi:hypothetical protein
MEIIKNLPFLNKLRILQVIACEQDEDVEDFLSVTGKKSFCFVVAVHKAYIFSINVVRLLIKLHAQLKDW